MNFPNQTALVTLGALGISQCEGPYCSLPSVNDMHSNSGVWGETLGGGWRNTRTAEAFKEVQLLHTSTHNLLFTRAGLKKKRFSCKLCIKFKAEKTSLGFTLSFQLMSRKTQPPTHKNPRSFRQKSEFPPLFAHKQHAVTQHLHILYLQRKQEGEGEEWGGQTVGTTRSPPRTSSPAPYQARRSNI